MKFYTNIQDWIRRKIIASQIAVRNDLEKSFLTIPIEIKKGKYKGLIYRYGVVKIEQEGVIRYEYDVLANGHLIDDNFIEYAGRVLTYLYIHKKYHQVISNNPNEDVLIKE